MHSNSRKTLSTGAEKTWLEVLFAQEMKDLYFAHGEKKEKKKWIIKTTLETSIEYPEELT